MTLYDIDLVTLDDLVAEILLIGAQLGAMKGHSSTEIALRSDRCAGNFLG